MTKRSAAVVLMLCLIGCKASVEGEEKAWTANQQKVKELSVLFPKFAPALVEQQAQVELALNEARGLADKDAAAKAMHDANALISEGWVTKLAGLEKKKTALDGKWTQAHADATAAGAADSIKELEVQVYTAQQSYKALLDNGADDITTASTLVKKVDGELSLASNAADKVSAEFKKRLAATKAAAVADAGKPSPADAGTK